MKNIILFFIALACLPCFSHAKKVKLHITDSIIYAQNNIIEINTQLLNKQDSSFILFNYLAVSNPLAVDSFFQTTNLTAGLIIYLKDKFGSIIPTSYPIGEPAPEHPAETVCYGALKDTSDNEFVNKMIVLKKKTTFKNKFCFDLYYSNVTKGTYTLYLFYFSGNNMKYVVSKDDLQSLPDKYKASIFKGWLRSNEVKLIVK